MYDRFLPGVKYPTIVGGPARGDKASCQLIIGDAARYTATEEACGFILLTDRASADNKGLCTALSGRSQEGSLAQHRRLCRLVA